MKDKNPPLTIETTRCHYFGDKAKHYNKDREDSNKWKGENSAVKDALKDTTGKVLDIPIGTGRFIPIYKKFNLDFIGMDVSEEMMVQAREVDPEAEIVFGDIMDIPLGDKSIESTVCTRLLNLMTEDEMVLAIKEMGRVTKERIICALFTGEHQERHHRHWVHRLEVFYQAVSDAGFEIEGSYGVRPPVYNVWRCVSR